MEAASVASFHFKKHYFQTMRNTLIQVFIVLITVALSAEIFLCVTNRYATYTEANGGVYVSEYGQIMPTWYRTHKPHHNYIPDAIDFKYPYSTNSLGIRDTEHNLHKTDSTFRIVVLGDSYTEGIGTSIDSTWPQLCNKYINHNCHPNIELISGAVAGSDQYFNYTLYRDKLRAYKPNLIIAAMNITDYTDVLLRGGEERFKSNGTTQFSKGPWYEPIYKSSRLIRAIFHKLGGFELTGIFISTNAYKQQLPAINQNIANVLGKIKEVATRDSAQFIIVLHATPPEFMYADKELTKANTAALSQLGVLLSQKGIDVINLQTPMFRYFLNKPTSSYTYTHDLHFNPHGYNIMALYIADSLSAKGIIPKTQQTIIGF